MCKAFGTCLCARFSTTYSETLTGSNHALVVELIGEFCYHQIYTEFFVPHLHWSKHVLEAESFCILCSVKKGRSIEIGQASPLFPVYVHEFQCTAVQLPEIVKRSRIKKSFADVDRSVLRHLWFAVKCCASLLSVSNNLSQKASSLRMLT